MKPAVACLLAALVLPVSSAQQPQNQVQPDETFRVDVKLVRVIATVKDKQGSPVGNLQKSDLILTDNGAPQEISVFEKHTAQPLSVAILLDISGSTAKEMKGQTAAVARFVSALFKEGNPDDQAALYSFNWQIGREVNWTRNVSRFSESMKKLKAEAGTALYDAIYVAANDLADRDGRHVMIVVSDGGNTFSTKDFHAAREAAHAADAVIYPVLTMPVTADAGRNIGGENALTTFARETGGKVFAPGAEGLDQAFGDILRDLRTQYLVGYYPRRVPLTKNRFHRLELRTVNPDLHVVSRTGYYGDAEPSADSPRR